MNRSDTYITDMRNQARQIWVSLGKIKDAQREWNALVYGTNLEDGTGSNAGITKLEVGPVVFDATNDLLAVPSLANLAKLL